MSDKKGMTLQERFDFHVERAEGLFDSSYEENVHGGYKGDAVAFATYAQLHATLALAIAQRMTAEATADVAESQSAMVQFKSDYGI